MYPVSPPHRILVIDDEPHLRAFLQRGLTLSGYTVETAASGETGLEIARQSSPDVVLVDMMMPGMGGYATLQRLCALIPRPKIFVVSGADSPENRAQAQIADGFLLKPFPFDGLLERIGAAIRQDR
jgi:two-component system, OmpR family, response regulator MprA